MLSPALPSSAVPYPYPLIYDIHIPGFSDQIRRFPDIHNMRMPSLHPAETAKFLTFPEKSALADLTHLLSGVCPNHVKLLRRCHFRIACVASVLLLSKAGITSDVVPSSSTRSSSSTTFRSAFTRPSIRSAFSIRLPHASSVSSSSWSRIGSSI